MKGIKVVAVVGVLLVVCACAALLCWSSVYLLGSSVQLAARTSTVQPTITRSMNTVVSLPLSTATPHLATVAALTKTPTRYNSPTPAILRSTSTPAQGVLQGLQRALMATVRITVSVDSIRRDYYGSGTIIDPRGYILTNNHMVRDTRTGRPYNALDRVTVMINSATDRPPDRNFRAEVVASDANFDLALLRIVSMQDGGPLPADLQLTTMLIGDSEAVQIGDAVTVIGFPGLGLDTVTLTRGIVAGFAENRAWIKTDTEISAGNSGGAAINSAGQLIGIPSEVTINQTGKIGYVRPINLAKPLFDQIK